MTPSGMTILLIGCEQRFQDYFEKLTREAGKDRYHLHYEASLDSGLELLQNAACDVCLLCNPHSTDSILHALQLSVRCNPEIPVILIAENDDPQLDLAAMENGAAGFLRIDELTASLLDRTLRYTIRSYQRRQDVNRSREHFHSILQDQEELICRLSGDYFVTFVNDAYSRFTGIPREQIVGHMLFDILPPEQGKKIKNHLNMVSLENPVLTLDYENVISTTESRWVAWTVRAIVDTARNIIEYQGVGRDITQMKLTERALQASEGLYRSLIEFSPEAVLVIQADTIVYANHAALQLYAGEMLIGSRLVDLVIPELQDTLRLYIEQTAGQGKLPTTELQIMRQDGRLLYLECNGLQIEYEARPALLILLHDISIHKQTEAHLAYQAKLLENISEAVIATDVDDTVMSWNPGAEHLYG
ncbi:MAG TPA: PAS domain S-box protein, partial [Aggregatilineales bacterium]|nr:PAS domain S-box protein [Aggregatilineales bacterium]